MDKNPRVRIGLPALIFFALLLFGTVDKKTLLPFLAAILHELGHLTAMALCGQKIKLITILPFGIDIKTDNSITSYKTDIFVSSAGILANLFLILISKTLPQNGITEVFITSNVMLAALNVLPIRSLDGGQILEKCLAMHFGIETAYKVTDVFSFVFILLLGSFAVWVLFRSTYNFTLLIMCIYLFCSIFLKK